MPTTPLIPKARTSGICAMDWYYDGEVPIGVADARGWDSLRQAQVKGGSRAQYWGQRVQGIVGEDDMGGEEITGEETLDNPWQEIQAGE